MGLTEVLIKVVVLHDVTVLDIKSDLLVFGLPESEFLVFMHDIVRQYFLTVE